MGAIFSIESPSSQMTIVWVKLTKKKKQKKNLTRIQVDPNELDL